MRIQVWSITRIEIHPWSPWILRVRKYGFFLSFPRCFGNFTFCHSRKPCAATKIKQRYWDVMPNLSVYLSAVDNVKKIHLPVTGGRLLSRGMWILPCLSWKGGKWWRVVNISHVHYKPGIKCVLIGSLWPINHMFQQAQCGNIKHYPKRI